MGAKVRPVDLGTQQARDLVTRTGSELRRARHDRGLSLSLVGRACGLSEASVSRIERGLVAHVSVHDLARLHAVVGLELSVRSYPGGRPIRDGVHVALLDDFRARLHPTIGWSVEVPLPNPRDQRAWDAFIQRSSWRYGIEAETAPTDSQSLIRRIRLKARDGDVDGVILVLRGTVRTRAFLTAAGESFREAFPIDGRVAVERMAAGEDPGGGSIVIVPERRVGQGPGGTSAS